MNDVIAVSTETKAARLRAIDRSGWGTSFRLFQPDNLAFWVYALLVGRGAVGLAQDWSRDASDHGATFVVAVLYFAAYSVPFWLYIRHRNRYGSEPAKLRAAGFVWGGTAAAFGLSIHANEALSSIYLKTFGFAWSTDWSPGASAPIVEEVAKAAGIVLLVAMASRLVRTAWDGAVIGACIGLGFQIIENITYVMNNASGRAAVGSEAINQMILRSFTGIASHVVYSAIMGMGVIWLWGCPDEPRRVGRGLFYVVGAVVLHAGWNTMKALGERSDVWDAVAPLVVSVASLTFLFAGLRVAAGREREWMRALLEPELERGTITSEELDALAGPRRARRTFAKAAEHRRERRTRRRVFDAVTDLAGGIAHARGEDTPAVEQARAELARVRSSGPDTN